MKQLGIYTFMSSEVFGQKDVKKRFVFFCFVFFFKLNSPAGRYRGRALKLF